MEVSMVTTDRLTYFSLAYQGLSSCVSSDKVWVDDHRESVAISLEVL